MIEKLYASPELQVPVELTPVTARDSFWRDLYLQAIFEPERTKVLQRIQTAEGALIRREHELGTEANGCVEREAVINALHCLEALRHCSRMSCRDRAA
jgi:hypothetical protein